MPKQNRIKRCPCWGKSGDGKGCNIWGKAELAKRANRKGNRERIWEKRDDLHAAELEDIWLQVSAEPAESQSGTKSQGATPEEPVDSGEVEVDAEGEEPEGVSDVVDKH